MASVSVRPSTSLRHRANVARDEPSEKLWLGPTATTARCCWLVAAGLAKAASTVSGAGKTKNNGPLWGTLQEALHDVLLPKLAVPRHDKRPTTTSNRWLDDNHNSLS